MQSQAAGEGGKAWRKGREVFNRKKVGKQRKKSQAAHGPYHVPGTTAFLPKGPVS